MSQYNEVRFFLQLTADEYESYYKGIVKNIQVTSTDGRTIRFPASNLRPYLTHSGVSGEFIMRFDKDNKFIELIKLDY